MKIATKVMRKLNGRDFEFGCCGLGIEGGEVDGCEPDVVVSSMLKGDELVMVTAVGDRYSGMPPSRFVRALGRRQGPPGR